jgi:hypothetical protein
MINTMFLNSRSVFSICVCVFLGMFKLLYTRLCMSLDWSFGLHVIYRRENLDIKTHSQTSGVSGIVSYKTFSSIHYSLLAVTKLI